MSTAARRVRAVTFATGVGIVGAGLLGACAKPKREPAVPAPDPVAIAWTAAYDDARTAITAGRYAHADSVLTAFRDRYVGMPQSTDALYWRAIARTGLVTQATGAHAAVVDLDAYRATGTADHLAEVTALGRALAQLDSARAAAATVVAPERVLPTTRTALVPRDSLRARDEELARVRADAAAAHAELDRIRRRLAASGRRP